MGITLPGTGETVRTDTVSGEKVEELKIGWGTAGAYNRIEEAAGLPVTLPDSLAASVGDSILALPGPGTAAWVHRSADYTTTQAGVELWNPASGKRCVVRQVSIEWYGSDDGNIFVWASTTSDSESTYTPGTDQLICAAHPTPSTKGNGGRDRVGMWVTAGANYGVRVTTSGNVDCTVTLEGYEETPPA